MASWDDDGYYDVCFAVEKSRRYHAKMREFYDWWHNLARVTTALTGTASFFVLLANGLGIAKWLTAFVAMAAAIDSVFRFERKARTQDGLYRRFTNLSARIAGWQPTPENLQKARAARLNIEADEPPVRRLVDLMAQNEECRARGVGDDGMVPLSMWQRTFGYVFTFGLRRLEQWDNERNRGAASSAASLPVAGEKH